MIIETINSKYCKKVTIVGRNGFKLTFERNTYAGNQELYRTEMQGIKGNNVIKVKGLNEIKKCTTRYFTPGITNTEIYFMTKKPRKGGM